MNIMIVFIFIIVIFIIYIVIIFILIIFIFFLTLLLKKHVSTWEVQPFASLFILRQNCQSGLLELMSLQTIQL